jgi:tyrosyl-tRNA synthetase
MRKILTDEIYRRLLERGVAEIIVEEELIKLLESGKRLRLKQGFDPSCPDIHLGHVVGLRKLRQFQELGHEVILIVGDWTAQIGDPSGRSQTRPMLSAEEVRANAETYMKQFFKVVDREKTKVVWQSEWFGKFSLADVIRLTSKFTVAQMLQRDDFAKRYAGNQPIAITEFLYPLLQAYDSVVIQSDVEFGGNDQKFNCLVGRELQQMDGQPPQQVFLMPLLVGTDGSMKMSKSLNNYIAVNDPPNDMYGKVLSIPDRLIMDYFELLTDVPDDELTIFRAALKNASVNPMILKKRLARELVTEFHDKGAAQEAERNFEKVVQQREIPQEIEEHPVSFRQLGVKSLQEIGRIQPAGEPEARGESAATEDSPRVNGRPSADYLSITIPFLLYDELGLVLSRSEAKRLLAQGAVEIDGQKVTGDVARIKDGSVVKVGKRRFKRIVNSDAQAAPADEQSAPSDRAEGTAPREEEPEETDVETIEDDAVEGQPRDISKWLVDNQLVKSAKEVERLMAQGEILIIRENGSRHTVSGKIVEVMPGDVIKYGKRRFAKIADYDGKPDAPEQAPEDVAESSEADIPEYRASFRELENEALLAAAREACAGDLIALKGSIATEAGDGEGATTFLVVTIPFILCKTGLVATHYEAKRLLARGNVKIDGKTTTKNMVAIKDGSIIKVGKGRPVKIVDADARS